MGTHKRSENGRGAKVALCSHPAYTGTHTHGNKAVFLKLWSVETGSCGGPQAVRKEHSKN
jgi:hypothetical protein